MAGFTIQRYLGRGGFGEVYRGTMSRQGGLEVDVAIKILRPDLDPESQGVQRLRDEGRLLGRLTHPTILRVYDLVVIEGRAAMITEYVDGEDLSRILRTESLSQRAAFEIIAQVAAALDAAWSWPSVTDGRPLQLVHRDIKPDNIRIDPHGVVKLLDFGLAQAQTVRREAHTSVNIIMGTTHYISPERMVQQEIGPEADVFALGCVLYEALMGEALFHRKTMRQMYVLNIDDGAFERFRNERFEDLAETISHHAVISLLREMTAYNKTSRPSAIEVARACDTLAESVAGNSLRRWCRNRAWPGPPNIEGPLDGAVYTTAQRLPMGQTDHGTPVQTVRQSASNQPPATGNLEGPQNLNDGPFLHLDQDSEPETEELLGLTDDDDDEEEEDFDAETVLGVNLNVLLARGINEAESPEEDEEPTVRLPPDKQHEKSNLDPRRNRPLTSEPENDPWDAPERDSHDEELTELTTGAKNNMAPVTAETSPFHQVVDFDSGVDLPRQQLVTGPTDIAAGPPIRSIRDVTAKVPEDWGESNHTNPLEGADTNQPTPLSADRDAVNLMPIAPEVTRRSAPIEHTMEDINAGSVDEGLDEAPPSALRSSVDSTVPQARVPRPVVPSPSRPPKPTSTLRPDDSPYASKGAPTMRRATNLQELVAENSRMAHPTLTPAALEAADLTHANMNFNQGSEDLTLTLEAMAPSVHSLYSLAWVIAIGLIFLVGVAAFLIVLLLLLIIMGG